MECWCARNSLHCHHAAAVASAVVVAVTVAVATPVAFASTAAALRVPALV